MKRYLLTIAFATLAIGQVVAQAQSTHLKVQENLKYNGKVYIKNGNTFSESSLNRRGANDTGGWYQFTRAYEEGTLLGTKLSTFVSFIYPDTTAYTVGDDGVKNKIGFHVLGTTFDPKDSNFLTVGLPTLTKFQSYTMDSIFFQQTYIRFLDSTVVGGKTVEVVDTAYVQYFDITGLDVTAYNYQPPAPPTRYYCAYPKAANFNLVNCLNSAAIKTDTILLNRKMKDSLVLDGANSSFYLRGIQIPVGLKSKSTSTTPISNNLMAWTVSFHPMVKTSLGDTLIAYDGSKWFKKYNMYGIRLAALTGHDQQIINQYKINNSIISNFQVRYGASFGPFKSYLAGTLFGNSIFMPGAIHITTSTLGTDKVSSNFSKAIVFPNPTSGGSGVNVAFQSRSNGLVNGNITDLNGRVVKSISSKNIVAGENLISFDTDGLAKGMYLIQIQGSNGNISAKFTVQ